jgi:hypothetical protein
MATRASEEFQIQFRLGEADVDCLSVGIEI